MKNELIRLHHACENVARFLEENATVSGEAVKELREALRKIDNNGNVITPTCPRCDKPCEIDAWDRSVCCGDPAEITCPDCGVVRYIGEGCPCNGNTRSMKDIGAAKAAIAKVKGES